MRISSLLLDIAMRMSYVVCRVESSPTAVGIWDPEHENHCTADMRCMRRNPQRFCSHPSVSGVRLTSLRPFQSIYDSAHEASQASRTYYKRRIWGSYSGLGIAGSRIKEARSESWRWLAEVLDCIPSRYGVL